MKLLVRHSGGDADEGMLDLYDGATSIQGFAQAIQIATHAFRTGETTSRATAMRGAKIYMKSARRGSYLTELVVLFEAYPSTSTIIAATTAPPFYDF